MLGQSLIIYTDHKALNLLYFWPIGNIHQVIWLLKMAEFSFKTVYLLGMNNSVADALSRQTGGAGQPDDGDIGESSSGPHEVLDPIVFCAVENWLKVVAPHLVLTNYIEAINSSLSSSHLLFAQLARDAAGNTWTLESMPNRGILYIRVLAVAINAM